MEFEPGMWKWLKSKVLRASWLSLSVDLLREGDKHHMWGIKRISSFFPKPFHLKWKSLSCVWIFVTPPWTVHGILQTRILEWVAFPFSRGSSQPRDWTQVSYIADSLPAEPQEKPKNTGVGSLSLLQWIFLTQESNRGLLHCRVYQLSYQWSPLNVYCQIL